ncbi:hypothetical protein [Streptomyces sp. NPDC020747]|uniref:hypothetical protein n=1 Tax=Streptomyces sp. NPDC020747 TaxID=3365086 RepID=UPI003793B651
MQPILAANPERFHLTLFSGGAPIAHGWWASRATADGKFKAWIGEFPVSDPRLTLVDEATGETLTEWPDV